MTGLRRANQSEKFRQAMGPEFVFITMISFSPTLFVNELWQWLLRHRAR